MPQEQESRSRFGRATDYARQAQADFALWELLERAGLLPPPGQLPTEQLLQEAKRRLDADSRNPLSPVAAPGENAGKASSRLDRAGSGQSLQPLPRGRWVEGLYPPGAGRAMQETRRAA